MIIEYIPEKIGERGQHVISGKDDGGYWRVMLVPGLNELTDRQVAQLEAFPGIEIYTERGAIAFRKPAETAFSRTHELEQLYESQGDVAIADIATKYGIAKPKSGWKRAIGLIVQHESQSDIKLENASN